MHLYRKYNEQYATAKADNSSIAQEDIGNIRTIKAFSNEKMSLAKYNKSNEEVTRLGAIKSVMWGLFIFGNAVLQKASFSAILYIIGIVYFAEEMTVGKTMAYLLYMQKLVSVFGEMSNELLAVARV
jgi:ABC-type multidrug transport system fused ATPase/permease subunit